MEGLRSQTVTVRLGSWQKLGSSAWEGERYTYKKQRRVPQIQHHDGHENTPLAVPDGVHSKTTEHCVDFDEPGHLGRARGRRTSDTDLVNGKNTRERLIQTRASGSK